MSFSVKTINNEIIKLEAKAFASGGEGLIHKVTSPSKYKNYCVKIYKDSISTKNRNHQAIKERERKITYMVKNPPSKLNASQWLLAWPKDVVYETNGNFLGFIMLLAFNKSVELFQLTNIKINPKLSSEWNKFDRSSGDGIKRRLMLNANIAIAVHHLHASSKYVIVDMKPQNFLVSPEGKVTVLDIDTIQISNNGSVIYPSKAMTAEYLPPESKSLTKNSPIQTDWDRFILGIIFYEVLFGVHPFAGTVFNPPYDNYATLQDKISNGLFPFGSLSPYVKNINAKGHLFLQRLPISIQDLFLDTFDKGLYKSDRRPSADAWGQTIYTVLKQQENINTQQSQVVSKQGKINPRTAILENDQNENYELLKKAYSAFSYKQYSQAMKWAQSVKSGSTYYSDAQILIAQIFENQKQKAYKEIYNNALQLFKQKKYHQALEQLENIKPNGVLYCKAQELTRECLQKLKTRRKRVRFIVVMIFILLLGIMMYGIGGSEISYNSNENQNLPQDEWSSFRGNNQNTGYYRGKAPKQFTELKWKFETDIAVISSPAVADGLVFFGGIDGHLFAVDIKTGREKWKFKTEDAIYSSPAVASGIVFFGSDDYHLYAVNMKNGREKWKFKTDDEIFSSPAVEEGIVFFGSVDHYLYAVDIHTGQEKWKFKTDDEIFSSPAAEEGIVFFGSADHYLYAVDINTGQEKWKFKTKYEISSSPAVAGGMVLFGSDDHHLYAVDMKTGQEKWKFKTEYSIDSSPAISEGMIFFGSNDNYLYAIR